jgi:hypothetical protein
MSDSAFFEYALALPEERYLIEIEARFVEFARMADRVHRGV